MAEDRHHRPLPEQERRAHGPAPPHADDERSVGELFSELARETQTLVVQEFQLAKTEIEEKAQKAKEGIGYLAAGGLVAYAGFIVVVAALGLLIGTALEPWAGLLISGGAVLIIGYTVLQSGLNRLKNTDFSFKRTTESLQEDKLWIKKEAQDVKQDPAHLGSQRK